LCLATTGASSAGGVRVAGLRKKSSHRTTAESVEVLRRGSMKRTIALLTAALVLALLPIPVGAQSPSLEPRDAPESLKGGAAEIVAQAPSLDERVKVFLQLSEPSVGQFIAEERDQGRNPNAAAKRNQANRIAAQQDRLRADLDQFNVSEEFELDYGANGLVVTARVGDLLAIADLPNVTSVARVARHEMTNETSVPFVGAPNVWGASGTGEGVSIAVIDSGIDYLHANFGGPGTIEAFENNDGTIVEPGTFPTLKVVGGTDLVGDAYDASSDDPDINTPMPDPDPLDCNGHGSHVAGSAAGNGVPDRIGEGVAPGSVLYAIRVFGCDGSSDVVSEAIEFAMDPDGDETTDDSVDVINMSLGSDFGDPNDPSAITSQTAVDLGVIVVVSAGNDGNAVSYVHGSPAVAPGVISVAAIHDAGVGSAAIRVNSPAGVAGDKLAQEGALGRPLSVNGPLTADLVLPQAGNANGCAPINVDMTGKIALIQRGVCTFAIKGLNAQAANAAALVVYNNAGNGLLTMGGVPENDIISMFIGQTDGTALAAAAATEVVSVTLDSAIEIPTPELADQVVGFSSRGPGGGGTTFKPEVSAPGVNIRSTLVGSGDRESVISGTSMSSPHVAGAAALLRQKYPDLAVDVIKSLIMNSAEPTLDEEPITLQGTGSMRVDAAAALGAYALPGGISFGRLNPITTLESTQTVTVHDFGAGAGDYEVSVEVVEGAPGVTVAAPSSVSVASGGSATFDVTVTIDPAAMTADDAFQSQRDINGRIHIDGPGGTLVVGYVAAVDPASAMTTAGTKSNGTQTDVVVSNPSSTVGVVDAFTHIGGGVGSIAAVGVRTGNIGGFDVVEFGIASTPDARWEALSSYETDIFIDTNQDGSDEYALVAADLGYLTTGAASGQVVTALFDLVNGGALLEYFVTGDFNDHAQVLTVDRFDDFGFLDANDATFDYLVAQFDIRFGLIGLAEGSVNLRNQADGHLNFSGALPPGASATIKVVPANRDDLLTLYSNNVVGDQFEVVALK
jgi:minor extracellular serine protease Vpr